VQSETARSPAAAARPGRLSEVRFRLQSDSKTAIETKDTAHSSQSSIGGVLRGNTGGGEYPRAVVVSATVAVAVLVPFSVTDDGETVHVAAAGAPVQAHMTVCVELFRGAAETVKLVCCPAAMVLVDGVEERR
jgi:hypothetical protein